MSDGNETPSARTAGTEFTISRILDAPRELVYRAWTEAGMMEKWQGPKGITCEVPKLDARQGGEYRWEMIGPDGKRYPLFGKFVEVQPNEKLVFTEDWSEHPKEWFDQLRTNLGPANEGALETKHAVTTVLFEEVSGKTQLTVTTQFESEALREAMAKMGMSEGWNSTMEKLEEFLAGK